MNGIEEVLKLSPPMLLIVALGCFGKLIKELPCVQNWVIPLVLPFSGALVYSAVGPAYPVEWILALKHPSVAYGMIGFVCGSMAVWGHQVWIQLAGRSAGVGQGQV
jgi:hypothetical protein